MKIAFQLNNIFQELEVSDRNLSLLWVIRDLLDMKGTKFGCGKASCGACTVLVDGKAVRSCSFAIKFAQGKEITTIEGLGDANNPHPIQQAWIDENVPQCGYCQPGFIMATAALLGQISNPTDDDIDQNIINICRCGTYYRIRKAIKKAASLMASNDGDIIPVVNEEK